MTDTYLNSLLKDYERKKLKAELDLEKRKQSLYDSYPEYAKIENELNSFGLYSTKSILNNSNFSIDNFNNRINQLKEQRTEFLYSHNLPKNYLLPYYECNICKDTGYVMNEHYKTSMCNCLKQKLLDNAFNKSNMTNLKTQNFKTFDENLFSNEINTIKYPFNISPRTNIKNIKTNCLDFIKNFDSLNQKNLLFTGNPGLRKNFSFQLYS